MGDDVDSVVQEFADEGKPIVSVETAGFKATNFESHSLVVNAILDQYVSLFDEENPPRTEKNTVNLFASLPYQDPFWKGNLLEYKRLLAGIGLKANVLLAQSQAGCPSGGPSPGQISMFWCRPGTENPLWTT